MITLTHTSPEEIKEIKEDGTFGSFLFYYHQTYSMGGHIVYELDIDSSEIIEASRMFYLAESITDEVDAIIAEVANRFGVSNDKACALIDGSTDGWNEIEWF